MAQCDSEVKSRITTLHPQVLPLLGRATVVEESFRVSAPCFKDVSEPQERICEIAMGLHVSRIGGEQLFVDHELPTKAREGTGGIAGQITDVAVVLIADREHAPKGGVGRILTGQ